MKVLVAVASQHSATRDIAEVIADELQACGLEVDLREADGAPNVAQYQAVVLGSAVYTGDWLPGAKHFVRAHGATLRTIPVWLFSSGPIGSEDAATLADPPAVIELMNATAAREHRVFAGRLDKRRLDLAERSVKKVVDAPEGDFRDLGAIIEWARSIGSSLTRGQAKMDQES